MSMEEPQYHITPVQQAAASCTGAILTSLLVTPLDVVKIRLQAQQKLAEKTPSRCYLYCNGLMDHLCGCSPTNGQKYWFERPGHFNGTLDAFVKITKNEGVYSLWSGLGPTLVLAIPTTILYFVTYEQLRLKLKKIHEQSTKQKTQPKWIPLVSGASARILAVTIVCPIELIRTKMQSKQISYSEIKQSLKISVQQDGYRGLWRGLLPTLYRDVPFSAIYWMNYETIKSFFVGSSAPTFGVSFLAGAISGSIAAFFTVPFDVVKTHQQIEIGEKTIFTDKPQKTKTTRQIIQEIYKHNGIRGLFAGLVPRLVKVAPSCAIMISSFEYGKIFFYRYNEYMFQHGTELHEVPDYYAEEYFPPEHT